jgi:hypothetical protein
LKCAAVALVRRLAGPGGRDSDAAVARALRSEERRPLWHAWNARFKRRTNMKIETAPARATLCPDAGPGPATWMISWILVRPSERATRLALQAAQPPLAAAVLVTLPRSRARQL